MKKMIALILAVLMAAALAGCGSAAGELEALRQQNETLLAENEQLKSQLAQLQQPEAPKKGVISGSFVATVRKLIPDYVYDDTTPMSVLVTQFQDTPFTILLGPDLIGQVEEGKTYEFTISDTEVDLTRYPNAEFMQDPAVFFAMNVKITVQSITPAEMQGLEGPRLTLKVS